MSNYLVGLHKQVPLLTTPFYNIKQIPQISAHSYYTKENTKIHTQKGASMAEKTPVTYTLLQLRTGKRWTQKEAAKKLGVSESTLSKWENAVRFPTMDQVWVIEDTYEVPLSGINFLPENTVKPYKNKQAS
nr:MAG TPA: Helix-turn-helix XRE-family like protein [Caudoviricetes sp.]